MIVLYNNTKNSVKELYNELAQKDYIVWKKHDSDVLSFILTIHNEDLFVTYLFNKPIIEVTPYENEICIWKKKRYYNKELFLQSI